jgi:AICAR transformylase/IMP cyclohydrolase PurH
MGVTYGLDPSGAGDVTSAYVRARDADPKSSFGDFVAVSHPVNAELADFLQRQPCDGIIPPGFEEGVVSTLAAKKRGPSSRSKRSRRSCRSRRRSARSTACASPSTATSR